MYENKTIICCTWEIHLSDKCSDNWNSLYHKCLKWSVHGIHFDCVTHRTSPTHTISVMMSLAFRPMWTKSEIWNSHTSMIIGDTRSHEQSHNIVARFILPVTCSHMITLWSHMSTLWSHVTTLWSHMTTLWSHVTTLRYGVMWLPYEVTWLPYGVMRLHFNFTWSRTTLTRLVW